MTSEPRGQIARATAVLAFAHVVQIAASLANLELLTRALGPSGYGELAARIAAWTVLGALTDLGTGLVSVSAMARAPERAGAILVATLRLRFLLALVASGAGAIRFAHDPAGLAGATLPIIQAWSGSRLILQARLANLGLARAQVLGRVLQVGAVALATRLHPDPLGAILALAAGELAIASLLRVEVGRLPRIPWRQSLADSKEIAWAALPLAGAFVANELAGSLDVLLLRALRTSEETGLYALASRPLQVLEPLPRLLLWSTFPILSRHAGEGDRAGFERGHRAATAALGLAAAPIAVLAPLAGPGLLAWLFDARYEDAARPLVILAWAGALSFLAAPAESALVALGKKRSNLLASLAGLGTNMGANALLIPRWGMLGAAWAWLATSAVQLVLAHALLGVRPPLRELSRSALAGGVVYCVLTGIAATIHPGVLVVLGLGLYGLAIFALGGRHRGAA